MSIPSPNDPRNALGQTRAEWLAHLSRIGEDHGYFESVAPRHMALFVQETDTLVVTFDRAERAFAGTVDGLPLGFAAVQRRQMSLLSIMASGPTWFRDQELFDFFTGLSDQGFFDSFRQIAFVGLGAMCGHAACAYSTAAKGAHVIAASPAATLDVERAGFDQRFRRARKKDFTSIYGYAPEALSQAARAMIVFDPYDATSAAHAAQFNSPNVIRAPLRWFGPDTSGFFHSSGALVPFIRALLHYRLNKRRVLESYREERRGSSAYLWRLAEKAQANGHFDRAAVIARHAFETTGEARFEQLIARLDPDAAQLAAG